HSEFSSILFHNHPFPWDRWQKVNVAGFSYPRSSLAFLDQRELYGQDNRLLNQGFVVKYAQSSLENDFNMITDWLFTRPSQLSTLADKYRRIGAKQDLAVRFYKSIDPRYEFYSRGRLGSS